MSIALFLSGGATNSNPALSLGGPQSAHPVPRQLFNVEDAQYTSGTTLYRLLYVKTYAIHRSVRCWIPNETPSLYTTLAIGWSVAGVNVAEAAVASQTTAPAGVSFASPRTRDTAPSGGDWAAENFRGLWVRLTVDPSPERLPTESFTLACDSSGAMTMNGNQMLMNGQDMSLVGG